MRSVRSFVIAMSLLIGGALTPARAATINVDYVDGPEVHEHFDPDYFVAHPGDQIHFDLRRDGAVSGVCEAGGCTVDVVQYAGTGTYFHSRGAEEFTTTFQGGVVWFHGPSSSALSRGGACMSLCGGFTDRPNPPSVPAVSQPADGAVLTHRDLTVSGTAEPWTVVSVRVDGGLAVRAMAKATGAWTTQIIGLSRGAHVAEFVAIDAARRLSPARTVQFTIGGESNPPSVMVENADPYVVLDPPVYEGVATDDSGIASVEMTIGGDLNTVYRAPCPTCPATSVEWRIELPDQTTVSAVRVKVEDVYGNVTLRNLTLIAVRSAAETPSARR